MVDFSARNIPSVRWRFIGRHCRRSGIGFMVACRGHHDGMVDLPVFFSYGYIRWSTCDLVDCGYRLLISIDKRLIEHRAVTKKYCQCSQVAHRKKYSQAYWPPERCPCASGSRTRRLIFFIHKSILRLVEQHRSHLIVCFNMRWRLNQRVTNRRIFCVSCLLANRRFDSSQAVWVFIECSEFL